MTSRNVLRKSRVFNEIYTCIQYRKKMNRQTLSMSFMFCFLSKCDWCIFPCLSNFNFKLMGCTALKMHIENTFINFIDEIRTPPNTMNFPGPVF